MIILFTTFDCDDTRKQSDKYDFFEVLILYSKYVFHWQIMNAKAKKGLAFHGILKQYLILSNS